jgi:hypothetical protein
MFNASFNMYTKLKEFVTNEISVPKEVLPQPTGRDRPHAPQAPGERPIHAMDCEAGFKLRYATEAGNTYPKLWGNYNNVLECLPYSAKTINS